MVEARRPLKLILTDLYACGCGGTVVEGSFVKIVIPAGPLPARNVSFNRSRLQNLMISRSEFKRYP